MIYIGAIIIIVVQNPQPEDTSEVPYEPSEATMQTTGAIACPRCDWHGVYDTQARAKQAYGGHKRFCNGRSTRTSPFNEPL